MGFGYVSEFDEEPVRIAAGVKIPLAEPASIIGNAAPATGATCRAFGTREQGRAQVERKVWTLSRQASGF